MRIEYKERINCVLFCTVYGTDIKVVCVHKREENIMITILIGSMFLKAIWNALINTLFGICVFVKTIFN